MPSHPSNFYNSSVRVAGKLEPIALNFVQEAGLQHGYVTNLAQGEIRNKQLYSLTFFPMDRDRSTWRKPIQVKDENLNFPCTPFSTNREQVLLWFDVPNCKSVKTLTDSLTLSSCFRTENKRQLQCKF